MTSCVEYNRPVIGLVLAAAIASASPVVAQQYERPRAFDILPLVDVDAARGRADAGQLVVDSYVRVEIVRTAADREVPRVYGNEMRSDLSRFFVGRTTSRVLTARFNVSGSTPISATVTLAAAAQRSNRRDGENFTSELSERRMVTPYFRVDAGAALGMNVELVASRRADADITRNFLSVVENATRLVAPSSSLVSSITAPRLNDAANFADQAISQLFSETIAETSRFEVPVRNWSDDGQGSQDIATISALFPFRTDRPEREMVSLGQWSVSLSPPIMSVFTETQLRRNASRSEADPVDRLRSDFAQLSPSQVLRYRLDVGLTVGEAVRGNDGVAAALLRFDATGADSEGNTAVIVDLCARIAEQARGLGLNRVDVAATVWAVTWSGILRQDLASALWANSRGRYACDAIELAANLGLQQPSLVGSTIVEQATIDGIQRELGRVASELTTIDTRVDQLEVRPPASPTSDQPADLPGEEP